MSQEKKKISDQLKKNLSFKRQEEGCTETGKIILGKRSRATLKEPTRRS